jgi:hypothetical protein
LVVFEYHGKACRSELGGTLAAQRDDRGVDVGARHFPRCSKLATIRCMKLG